MLLQFSVNNYCSIKDTIVFSMATATKDNDNFFSVRNYDLLKSAVIYGANASGKSNLLRAIAFMGRLVLNKTKVLQSTDTLPHDPFKLNTSTKDASSSFEVVFFVDKTKYRYGFELDSTTIYSEWLYADENGKEAKLFYRDADDVHYVNRQKFKEGYQFFNKANKKIKITSNQLFLWKCDRESDGIIAKTILQWFSRLNLIDGLEHRGYENFTIKKMEDEDFRKEIVKLVKTADIGIEDITINKEEVPSEIIEKMPLPDEIKDRMIKNGGVTSISLNTYHKMYDANNKETGATQFELEDEESIGTRKFFKISAPILETLKEGKILLIDELDASLHPKLTRHLISLFHDKNINTKNAQLIFATHDTNLLKPHIFRRDQIWFSEKDKYGATTVYALAELKNVRKTEDFENQYIQGKYGAIPYLGKFEF